MSHKEILHNVGKYYSDKLKTFGTTPQGVDWNSEESQHLRFSQLLAIIPEAKSSFSLLDYGCGFGSLYQFMKPNYPLMKYNGFDISETMIKTAEKKFNNGQTQWFTQLPANFQSDYVIASGIFNVKLDHTADEWEQYITDSLNKISVLALKGFSFNVLTSYSDKEFMRSNLHYANPCFLFDYCKRNFSKYVALNHDYPLYEFTILVRKQL